MVHLENSFLKVIIADKGAELKSVSRKDTDLEYMWSGNPEIWGKTSPILFPIVGSLKNGSFIFSGSRYHLNRHGFARDSVFEIENQSPSHAVFLLKSNAGTLENYPFAFELRVVYSLSGQKLNVEYHVQNTGEEDMYFSMGGHPAFKVPLVDGTDYSDYYLEFERTENAPRWPVDAEGLIESIPEPFFNNTSRINITHELFSRDALVFKNLSSHRVSLKSGCHNHGLDFNFEGFPFLGLWAAKGGDFVCIEPWCGIADAVNQDGQLTHKEGIIQLNPESSWSRVWSAEFY